MKISKIEIKNFKSFKDISLDLNNFNTVIGESASGKSNFIEVFKFLKDICDDYKNGIMRHGNELLQNINLKSKNPTYVKVVFTDDSSSFGIKIPNKFNNNENNWIYYNSIEYELCIDFKENEEIINEFVKLNYLIKDNNDNDVYSNSIFLKNNDGHVEVKFKNNELFKEEFFVPEALLNIVNNNFKQEKGLLINSPLSSVPILWSNHIKSFEFYNLDPKFSKISFSSGNGILSEYGDNLSYFLEKILNNKSKKKEFMNLVSDLLPYIEDIDILSLNDNKKYSCCLKSIMKKQLLGLMFQMELPIFLH